MLLAAWKYRHERWIRGSAIVATDKDQTHHLYEPIRSEDGHGETEMSGVINENIRVDSSRGGMTGHGRADHKDGGGYGSML